MNNEYISIFLSRKSHSNGNGVGMLSWCIQDEPLFLSVQLYVAVFALR